ncbi:SHOCT domain-containing protein [soil metagenome]
MWDEQGHGYGYGGMMSGGAAGWLMVVLMVLLVVAVVVGLVLALRRLPASSVPTVEGASGRARLVLDERFARGEIDHDEYASRRSALE